MSYNYTQLHQIIETQYKSNNNNGFDFDFDYKNWFLNESAKLFKGYTTPSKYFNNIRSGNINNSNDDDDIIIKPDEPPIYVDF